MCATGDVGTIIKNDNSTKPYEVKASDGKTWWYHKEALSAVCDVGGCTRVTWNGDFGAQCCRTCKSSGGASHGPECEAKAKKAACPIVPPSSSMKVGDRVRVKRSVSEPKYKWGAASHESSGTLQRIDDDGDVIIRFPGQSSWRGRLDEIEKLRERFNSSA